MVSQMYIIFLQDQHPSLILSMIATHLAGCAPMSLAATQHVKI